MGKDFGSVTSQMATWHPNLDNLKSLLYYYYNLIFNDLSTVANPKPDDPPETTADKPW